MIRQLVILSMLPFLASVALYLIFQSEKNSSMSEKKRQIIAGLVFGVTAIMATEFGVQTGGAILNSRNASPLCAGLFFGPWAGIISGIIGGVERWFCVYWGGAFFTRNGCALATILTGFIAAFLREKIFEKKIPEWELALYSGVFCETLDMILILVTNSETLEISMDYIGACATPMIIINSLSVAFSAFFMRWMERDIRGKLILPTIATEYQRSLITLVFVVLILTSLFSFLVQRQASIQNSFELMVLNGLDAYDDIISQVRSDHVRITREMAEDYFYDLPDQGAEWLADYYDVEDLFIIDKDGVIVDTNNASLMGANVRFVARLEEMIPLFETNMETVPYADTYGYDRSIAYRQAGLPFADHFVITSLNVDQFKAEILERLDAVVENRRVGEWGKIIVCDKDGTIIADNINEGRKATDIGLEPTDALGESGYLQRRMVTIGGETYYYIFMDMDFFDIYVLMAKDESDFSRNMSTYLNIFMQVSVFGVMFIFIFYLTKHHIVNKIDDVNESLEQITKGELDTVVDVGPTEEFLSLSGGINITVDALKKLIAEANERIDTELRYAKEIQFSALERNFPQAKEYDLYAIMDPAREVGGDFYDFYMINSHTLAILVADVSGKGIPASLFMMRSKTMIRNYAEAGMEPGEIFTNANEHLCKGNDANMFVTAWMGFLDLRNGEFRFANAGHNPPLLKRKNGNYEYLKSKAGFVLAAMNGMKYSENSIVLEPGDKLFAYTDGVVEATNKDKELYGESRLADFLNEHQDDDARTTCELVKENVDEFYKGVAQFDDITEMSLIYKQYMIEEQKG